MTSRTKDRLEDLATYAIATILAFASIVLVAALAWSATTRDATSETAAAAASSINATAMTVILTNLATQK